MSSAQKNPYHPSSLTTDDMTPERVVLTFNQFFGVSGPFTVVGAPEARGEHAVLVIRLQDVHTGKTYDCSLHDLGVAPYNDGHWNSDNFVVDSNDRYLLPGPTPKHPA